jgi:tetratricopeptide (TPR) repeat protein
MNEKLKQTALCLIFLLAFYLPATGQNEDLAYLLYQGKTEQVINRFQPKFEAGKLAPESLLMLAQAYQKEKRYSDVLDVLKKGPKSLQSLSLQAEAYSMLGNLPAAVTVFKKILATDPDNSEVQVDLGKLYLQLDRDLDALYLFKDLATRDSTNFLFRRLYALSCYRTDRIADAVDNYDWVVKKNPDDLASLLNLVNILQQHKMYGPALEYIKAELKHFPDNLQLKKKAGEINFLAQNYQKAADFYQDVLPVDSSYIVKKYYGISLFFERKEDKSLKLLESCYRKVKTDDMVAFYIGLCLKRKAEYQESAHFLETAIKLATPGYLADFYHHLADVYDRDRRFQDAIDGYKKALEYDSTRTRVLFDMATTYEEFNNNKTIALGYYREYLKRMGDSDNPNVDYALKRIRKIKEDLFMDQ